MRVELEKKPGSLSPYFFISQNRKINLGRKGEERKVEIEFWARGLFSRTRKNKLNPGKIEKRHECKI